MGLRTTRAFSIGGRRYKAGDPIDLTGKHLRIFQAIGYVEYGPEEYQGRQLAPEPAAVTEPESVESENSEESAPKSRRSYRRRDLKAGD